MIGKKNIFIMPGVPLPAVYVEWTWIGLGTH